MNFSFAGCGFMGIYHVGVSACLKKYAPDLLVNKISGASAGALAAVCLLCDSPLGDITTSVLKTATEARKKLLGPFSPSFNVEKLLREGLLAILPDDAHEIVSGRLFISVTRVCDGKNILISQFDSREELVTALLCSAFIPGFSGWLAPKIKGVRYVDGGFSDNLPQLDGSTITVSPFSGECDIGPKDSSNAGLITINLANTSIELSRENLYRFSGIIFPQPPKVLDKICQQGFYDALEFLQRNNLISCTTCLTIDANIHGPSVGRKRSIKRHRKKFISNVEPENPYSDTECHGCRQQQEEAVVDTLPEVVETILQESIETHNRGLLHWVFKRRSINLTSILTLPFVLPLEIAQAAATKFINSTLPESDLKKRAQQIVNLVQSLMDSWLSTGVEPRRVHTHEHTHEHTHAHTSKRASINEDFTCQLAITEIGGEDEGIRRHSMPFNLNFDQSNMDMSNPDTDTLNEIALKCGLTVVSRPASRMPSRAASRRQSRAPSIVPSRAVSYLALDDLNVDSDELDRMNEMEDEDGLENLIMVAATQNETVMSYYYKDDNDECKYTGFFDIATNDDLYDDEESDLYSDENDEFGSTNERPDFDQLHSKLELIRKEKARNKLKLPKFTIEPPSSSSSRSISLSEPEADQHRRHSMFI